MTVSLRQCYSAYTCAGPRRAPPSPRAVLNFEPEGYALTKFPVMNVLRDISLVPRPLIRKNVARPFFLINGWGTRLARHRRRADEKQLCKQLQSTRVEPGRIDEQLWSR